MSQQLDSRRIHLKQLLSFANMTQLIPDGSYNIQNVEYFTYVSLKDETTDDPVVAVTDNSTSKQKWVVTADNASANIYTIKNEKDNSPTLYASGGISPQKDTTVTARAGKATWVIAPGLSQGQYLISDPNGDFIWGLADSAPKTEVTLSGSDDKSEKCNQWQFITAST
ncbi:hypothetical protein EXIGLDRAFT_768268 [Exidia glandulosa HHB12029]|uniref:Ricin B lectin domain-containing protein n=1 Tax=Exidia glandulosa HHB12029 TaxID=1314781 RepID=A0A166ALX6_EXIGL|nr:hypothetical protein EXIGLDRAFT_768268 [Exidia glandulosa HHB12029]